MVEPMVLHFWIILAVLRYKIIKLKNGAIYIMAVKLSGLEKGSDETKSRAASNILISNQ